MTWSRRNKFDFLIRYFDPSLGFVLIHEHEWIKVNREMLCLNNTLKHAMSAESFSSKRLSSNLLATASFLLSWGKMKILLKPHVKNENLYSVHVGCDCSCSYIQPPFEFTYIWILLSVFPSCFMFLRFPNEVKMYIKRQALFWRLSTFVGLKPTATHFRYDTKNVSL